VPAVKKKGKAWIAVVVVVLLLVLGGGGYIDYTKLLAGGVLFSPSPTDTLGVVIPVSSNTEVILLATSTVKPTQTLPPEPTNTSLPSLTPTEIQTTTLPTMTSHDCTDPLGCVKIGPTDPIHIAYLLAITGPNSAIGIDSRNGVEIAIDDTGREILGHAIQFDGEDGGCTTEGGAAAGAKLAFDPSIVAIIGTSCSSEARAALPTLTEAGLAVISPSNTTPDLTDLRSRNHHAGYFRTAYNDIVQGAAAADFVYNDLGFRRVATIHDGSLYAEKLAEIFRDEFIKLGGQITASKSILPDDTDMKPVLSEIATGNPQLIYFPIFLPAGTYIIKQAHVIRGLESIELMGGDGLFSPDVMQAGDKFIEGFIVSSPIIQGPAYDRFVIRYEAKFGTEPISVFHAHAYDAFNILKAAIEKVAVQDADGTIYIPRQALRDAIAATSNFKGITGMLTCKSNGDCADPIIGVYEYKAGEYPPELIWP
jgi:branched-chain amino acid transport system substrate-binding protein